MGYLKLRTEALRLDKAVEDAIKSANRFNPVPTWVKEYIDRLEISRNKAWTDCWAAMDVVNKF